MNKAWGVFLVAASLLLVAGCGGGSAGLGTNKAAPVASFTANPQDSTTYPVTVTFNASASNDPDGGVIVQYEWDFNYNGLAFTPTQTLTTPVVGHDFTQAGTYIVMLRVTDSDESRTGTATVTIRVFPAAAITVNDNLICIGNDDTTDDSVTFDASGSQAGPSATITNYKWDFDYPGAFVSDLDTGLVATTAHTYTIAKNYTAAVQVTSSTLATGIGTVAVQVVELTANFTMPPSGAPGLSISFDAGSSVANNTVIINYHWEFGDGQMADTTSPTTTHTYSSQGTMSVKLTITDSKGFTDSITKSLPIATLAAVIWAAVAPAIPADTSAVSGGTPLTLVCDETHCVGPITHWAWDWEWTDTGAPGPDAGDFTADADNTTAAVNRQRVYSTVGIFTAVLRVTDGTLFAYDTVTITVTAPPLRAELVVSAGATADPNERKGGTFSGNVDPGRAYIYYVTQNGVSVGTPANVTFDMQYSSGAILVYTLSFGDGTADVFVIPPANTQVHGFTTEGVFQVSLKVEDGGSWADTATCVVTVVDTAIAGHGYFSHALDASNYKGSLATDPGDKDTSVSAVSPDTNFGDNHIHIDSYASEVQNVLFQTDPTLYPAGELAPATQNLLQAAIVISAYRLNGADGTETIEAYKSLAAWDESLVTWNNKPGMDTTNYVVGTYLVPPLVASNRPTGFVDGNSIEFPVHPMAIRIEGLLNDWASTPANNKGAYLIATNGNIDLSFAADGWMGGPRATMFVGIKKNKP